MPPAPEVLPLHPLAEPPAPALSPLQALLPAAQLLRVKVDPAIRPAIQKPARIFLRSSTSMVASCEVKGDIIIFPGAGTRQTDFVDEMPVLVSKMTMVNAIVKNYQIAFWMSIMRDTVWRNRPRDGFARFQEIEKMAIQDPGRVSRRVRSACLVAYTFLSAG